MTSTELSRQIVGQIPPGAPLNAAGEAMKGLGSCYPNDALSMMNAPNGGLWIIYDPNTKSARSTEADQAARNTGNYSMSIGTATDENTFTVNDADLITFALQVTGEDETIGIQAMAQWAKNLLGRHNAANYLAMTLDYPEAGERYAFTVQRVSGLTPAEKIAALHAENADLKQRLTDLEDEMREEATNRES